MWISIHYHSIIPPQPLPMYHFFFSCPAQGTTIKNPMKTGAYSTLFSDFQFLSTAQRTFKYKTTLKRNNKIILKTTLCYGVKYTKIIVVMAPGRTKITSLMCT